MSKTKMEKLESLKSRMEHNTFHIKALIDGLCGRPQDWIWKEEVFEDDSGNAHCVCGHPIIYCFIVHDITNDNNTKILGSTCIGNYSQFRPEDAERMWERWIEIQNKIAEEKKKAKEAVTKEEIRKLATIYSEKLDVINKAYTELRNKKMWAPRPLWLACDSRNSLPKDVFLFLQTKYNRVSTQRNWLKRTITQIDMIINECLK
jgi:hypothetical protein